MSKKHPGKHADKANNKPGPAKGAKYQRRKPKVAKRCVHCNREFSGLLSRGIYCSSRCRDTAGKRRRRGKGTG